MRAQLLEGASLSVADRCRALSSSSTESSTYIADAPSAIYHASSSALIRDRYFYQYFHEENAESLYDVLFFVLNLFELHNYRTYLLFE